MAQTFDENKPIFIQIKEKIADQIVKKQLIEDEQIPSTTQMVQFYKVNHITITKGINLLVDDGILYKKRGIGTFVEKGARHALLEKRKEEFIDRYVLPMVQEANKLELTDEELGHVIKKVKEGESI
ncbi:GntR family transcriptional regulator [Amphibacillus indicireducens]|uniref:GntR family transcriptional regulator n=1 Tax=Amphibacillus indicireducens TaxID=1076330 RepID=A0ABP7VWD0_9BACI